MMTEKISFSIVIPTYNRAGMIARAIQSVREQTYNGYEIIVVDDGSTDNTKDVINALKKENLTYHYQSNQERGAARNKGVTLATGDYIVFLDSDDFLYPHFLENALQSLKTYQYPGFLYMGFEMVDTQGNKKGRSAEVKNDDVLGLVKGNILGCVGTVVRRDVAQKFRFMETHDLFSGEDWELWTRITSNFGLKADNRISGAALMHEQRSMHAINVTKLTQTKSLLVAHMFTDEQTHQVFGPYKRIIESNWDTFIALHLMLGGYRWKGLRWWFKGVIRSPRVFFTKRTLAVFKRFITG